MIPGLISYIAGIIVHIQPIPGLISYTEGIMCLRLLTVHTFMHSSITYIPVANLMITKECLSP